MRIGVLLPALNEEKNIRNVIREAKFYLRNPKIVVVDDGSKDRTKELARKSGVKVLTHKKNKGKGEALKTGFKYFLTQPVDVVVVADTDGQYPMSDAKKLLEPFEKNEVDLVGGYRDWSTVPFRHNFGNLVWRSFFNILFGTNLKDTNCGFIAIRKNAMKKIRNLHGGYIVENAIFSDAVKNKLRIKQVQVRVIYKHKSGMSRGVRMVLGVLIFIIQEGIRYRLGKK